MSNKPKIMLIDEDSWSDFIEISNLNDQIGRDREFYMKKIVEVMRECQLDYVDYLMEIQKMKNDLLMNKVALVKKN